MVGIAMDADGHADNNRSFAAEAARTSAQFASWLAKETWFETTAARWKMRTLGRLSALHGWLTFQIRWLVAGIGRYRYLLRKSSGGLLWLVAWQFAGLFNIIDIIGSHVV